MKLFRKMRKQKVRSSEAQQWFEELDTETQQETALKYLRKLDNKSLKNFIKAVDHFREGDKILSGQVTEPESENDLLDATSDS